VKHVYLALLRIRFYTELLGKVKPSRSNSSVTQENLQTKSRLAIISSLYQSMNKNTGNLLRF